MAVDLNMLLHRTEGRLDGTGGEPIAVQILAIHQSRIIVSIRGTARSGRVADIVVNIVFDASYSDRPPVADITDDAQQSLRVESHVTCSAFGIVPGTESVLEAHDLDTQVEPGWLEADDLSIRIDSERDPCFWVKFWVPGQFVRMAINGGRGG